MARKKKPNSKVDWRNAPDVRRRIFQLKKSLNLDWVQTSNIYCFRSTNSTSRAQARIWGLSRIWQMALGCQPAYIIEVLSEKYDRLSTKAKDEVLLHEMAHIPQNFSGSLLPHVRRRGKRNFNDRVKQLVVKYKDMFR